MSAKQQAYAIATFLMKQHLVLEACCGPIELPTAS